jgi:hypothetical protein
MECIALNSIISYLHKFGKFDIQYITPTVITEFKAFSTANIKATKTAESHIDIRAIDTAINGAISIAFNTTIHTAQLVIVKRANVVAKSSIK